MQKFSGGGPANKSNMDAAEAAAEVCDGCEEGEKERHKLNEWRGNPQVYQLVVMLFTIKVGDKYILLCYYLIVELNRPTSTIVLSEMSLATYTNR